jgi:hypothetical protein
MGVETSLFVEGVTSSFGGTCINLKDRLYD